MATSTTSQIEYKTTVFNLKADYLGPNIGTLLHARTSKPSGHFYKAILYIHGYSDYFFQDHVCQQFLDHGYDFYALDLRKCGRSIISPAQDLYKHYFSNISEYYEEITLSIEHIIKVADGKSKKLILLGHSTGGLVVSAYASFGSKRDEVDALILNSPYLAPLGTNALETLSLGLLTSLGFSRDLDDIGYCQSIHSSKRGEWNFDSKMKPIDKIRLHGASFAAIRQAQISLAAKTSCLQCPILLLCAQRYIKPDQTWRDEYFGADLLLDVTPMRRFASTMGEHVTIHAIENAMHDVYLSKAPIRDQAFRSTFRWLKQLEEDWQISKEQS